MPQHSTIGLCMSVVAFAVAVNRTTLAQCYSWSAFGDPNFDGIGYIFAFHKWLGGAKELQTLFVGGQFNQIGGIPAKGVAAWNGIQWSPLGSGTNGNVYAIAVFNSGKGPEVYAGGFFISIGGVSCNAIAKWDGVGWSCLGEGLALSGEGNLWVAALRVFDDGSGPALFVGGTFTSAGGEPAKNIAKWTGDEWIPIDQNNPWLASPYGSVRALEVYTDETGTGLYAGGDTIAKGGIATPRIAKWNGASWAQLTGLMNQVTVTSLKAIPASEPLTGLYAGSYFRVGRYHNQSWTQVGGNFNSEVESLETFDDGGGLALYAGGRFTSVGAQAANRVAKWNGNVWAPLLDGVDASKPGYSPSVMAMCASLHDSEPALIVGGIFDLAGNEPALNMARWSGPGIPPTILEGPVGVQAGTGESASLSVQAKTSVEPISYQWFKDGIRVVDDNHITGSTTETLSIDPIGMVDAGAYHVRVSNPCGAVDSDFALIEVQCTADIGPNIGGDGVVNVTDLLIVITFWGNPDALGGIADVNDDGFVNVDDLLMVINHWGPCL